VCEWQGKSAFNRRKQTKDVVTGVSKEKYVSLKKSE
jgi:hypothetical protein